MARGVGRRRAGGAESRARLARVRAPGRVLVVLRARCSRSTTPSTPIRRVPSAQPGDGRFLRRRRSTPRRRHLRSRRTGSVGRRARRRARHGPRSRVDPRPHARQAAHPVIPTTILSGPDSLSAACPFVLHVGSGRLPDRESVDGRRAAALRAVQRGRDHRLEGLHGRVPHRGSLPLGPRPRRRARAVSPVCAAALSRWVPDGCPTCFAGSITPPRSGAAPSRGSRRSSEPRRSRRARSSASRRIRSRTSRGYPQSRTRACTCSRRTIPMPKGGRDPLGRFERSWAGTSAADDVVAGFFAVNAAGWLGVEQPA